MRQSTSFALAAWGAFPSARRWQLKHAPFDDMAYVQNVLMPPIAFPRTFPPANWVEISTGCPWLSLATPGTALAASATALAMSSGTPIDGANMRAAARPSGDGVL